MKQSQYAIGFMVVILVCAASWARSACAGATAQALGFADFDADGHRDPARYTASSGAWVVELSGSRYQAARFTLGGPDRLPSAGDYDGDRKSDPVVYNTASGVWMVLVSSWNYLPATLTFAETNGIPVSGDFDGDGKADPGLFCPALGTWRVFLSGANYAPATATFGSASDLPVVEDYDGDGKADPAIFTPSTGGWKVLMSGSGYALAACQGFGGATSLPAVGDYDGDGKADPAFLEPGGIWSFLLSAYHYALAQLSGFGGSNGVPAVGDYDGDRRADSAYFNPDESSITVALSSGNFVSGALVQTNVLTQSNTVIKSVAQMTADTVGVVYHSQNMTTWDVGNIRLRILTHGGDIISDEEVLYDGSPMNGGQCYAARLFSVTGLPQLIVSYPTTNYSRMGPVNGTWIHETIGSWTESSDALAQRTPGGVYHVVTVSAPASADYARVEHISNLNGVWMSETYSFGKAITMSLVGKAMAADTNGGVHVVLSFSDRPNQDVSWPGYLFYLRGVNGAWSSELIASQAHSSQDATFKTPQIALFGNGVPAVAAHVRYNVMTGSDSLSQLVYAWRAGAGQWPLTVIADTADDYFGSDGGHFTGWTPQMAIDSANVAHILFSDLASSHVNGYESAIQGQIRYAKNAGAGWAVSTLFRQNAAAGQGLADKQMALSADGSVMDVVTTFYPGYALVHFSNARRSVFLFE